MQDRRSERTTTSASSPSGLSVADALPVFRNRRTSTCSAETQPTVDSDGTDGGSGTVTTGTEDADDERGGSGPAVGPAVVLLVVLGTGLAVVRLRRSQ